MDWLQNEAAVNDFVKSNSVEELLKNGDMARVTNFFPDDVAEAVFQAVRRLPDWERADGGEDVEAGYGDAIGFGYSLAEIGVESIKKDDIDEGDEAVSDESFRDRELMRRFGALLWRLYRPEKTLPNFTAACYGRSDHIEPHDDFVLEEYTLDEIDEMQERFAWEPQDAEPSEDESSSASEEEEEREVYEREIAMVFYMNKDWKPSYGGAFVDYGPDALMFKRGEIGYPEKKLKQWGGPPGPDHKLYMPEFNSVVFFRVPRVHMVQEVVAKRQRYSIFGWWLRPHEPSRKMPTEVYDDDSPSEDDEDDDNHETEDLTETGHETVESEDESPPETEESLHETETEDRAFTRKRLLDSNRKNPPQKRPM